MICRWSWLLSDSAASSTMTSLSVVVVGICWFFCSLGSRLTAKLCVATGLNVKLFSEEAVLERLLPLDVLRADPITTRNSRRRSIALDRANVDTTLLGQSIRSAGTMYMSRMHDASPGFAITVARSELRIVCTYRTNVSWSALIEEEGTSLIIRISRTASDSRTKYHTSAILTRPTLVNCSGISLIR